VKVRAWVRFMQTVAYEEWKAGQEMTPDCLVRASAAEETSSRCIFKKALTPLRLCLRSAAPCLAYPAGRERGLVARHERMNLQDRVGKV
jgi:hypothetical protein